MQRAIDIHSHMLSHDWLDLLRSRGGPRVTMKRTATGEWIHVDGAPFMLPVPAMFDYEARLRSMDGAGVGMAVLSLTGPNVYWGDAEASAQAARLMNDSYARAQQAHPDRFRWLASLPMQYPAHAVAELRRALDAGAVGAVVLGNVAGTHLIDPQFAPVWEEIDRRALPVFVHPTVPCGCAAMGIDVFQLTASIGFTYDSTLAVSLMIHTGFFDRYPRMRLIVAHGGGTLPFLAPRLDRCFDSYADCRTVIQERPSAYLRRLYADSALFSTDTLRLTLSTFGDDHVLYGTDFPHGLSDMKGTLARIAELDAATRDKVRGANAERLFGIPAVPHSP